MPTRERSSVGRRFAYGGTLERLGVGCGEADQLTFFELSGKSGPFEFGKSDVHIADADDRFQFTVCHEADIHFSSHDPDRVQQVIRDWQVEGIFR